METQNNEAFLWNVTFKLSYIFTNPYGFINMCSVCSSRKTSKLHTLQTLYKHYRFVHAKDLQEAFVYNSKELSNAFIILPATLKHLVVFPLSMLIMEDAFCITWFI